MSAPFLASIITMSSHEPFNIPHFQHDPHFDAVEPPLTGRYFASIAYTDKVLADFIAKVQQKFSNTYFFIYGDHTPFVIRDGCDDGISGRYGVAVKGTANFWIAPA